MKSIFFLFSLILFASFTPKNELPFEQVSYVMDEEDEEYKKWKKHQDSLRNELIKRMENPMVSQSFLQELYIRDAVRISNDSLLFKLKFDLHGGCIAPDCFITEVSFQFPLGEEIVFPTELLFQEHEYGCVENEYTLEGTFHLIEKTEQHIIYHSSNPKRTLVLFSPNNKTGSTVYYFLNAEKDKINGQTLYTIYDEYEIENDESLLPILGWSLSLAEYEIFFE